MRIPRTLAIVLAGGKGSRLGSLTDDTVKPALPFAGPYRLIDIALSNLAHSHLSDVWIAEQYLPHSLNEHLAQGRPWDLDRLHGGLQVLAPFEGATGEGMAQGNSDTLWRHRERIRSFGADHVLVLSADHVYTLDFLEVLATRLNGAQPILSTAGRCSAGFNVTDGKREYILTAGHCGFEPASPATLTVRSGTPGSTVDSVTAAEEACNRAGVPVSLSEGKLTIGPNYIQGLRIVMAEEGGAR